MEVSSWENLLFLWAIYTTAMLNNQRVGNPHHRIIHFCSISFPFLEMMRCGDASIPLLSASGSVLLVSRSFSACTWTGCRKTRRSWIKNGIGMIGNHERWELKQLFSGLSPATWDFTMEIRKLRITFVDVRLILSDHTLAFNLRMNMHGI